MEPIKEVVDDIAETAQTFSSKGQATKRAELDMSSDTKLSKNIRPIALIWALSLLTISMLVKSLGVELDDTVLDTIYWVNIIVLSFYFPGRTIEKWAERRSKK